MIFITFYLLTICIWILFSLSNFLLKFQIIRLLLLWLWSKLRYRRIMVERYFNHFINFWFKYCFHSRRCLKITHDLKFRYWRHRSRGMLLNQINWLSDGTSIIIHYFNENYILCLHFSIYGRINTYAHSFIFFRQSQTIRLESRSMLVHIWLYLCFWAFVICRTTIHWLWPYKVKISPYS